METGLQGILPITIFSQAGSILMAILLISAGFVTLSAVINLFSPKPLFQKTSSTLLIYAGFTGRYI
jgi:hypothetical protein